MSFLTESAAYHEEGGYMRDQNTTLSHIAVDARLSLVPGGPPVHRNSALRIFWGFLLHILALSALFFTGLCRPAYAQQPTARTTQFEVSGGYAYVRGISNPGNGFNVNGAAADLSYNFHERIAVVADFGAYHFTSLGLGLSSTMYTYLFGPRLALRRSGAERRFVPFGQVLAGGGHVNASANGLNAGENSVLFAAGAGIDLSFSHRIAFRAIEGEYFLSRFNHPDGSSATQNNVRISAGLVFRFGKK